MEINIVKLFYIKFSRLIFENQENVNYLHLLFWKQYLQKL